MTATDDSSTVLDSVRLPEYTGENRCVPCTALNVAIAAVASGLVALRSLPAAVALFAGASAVIYLRGYLVPYTPTLTRRYLPDRVLAWFDKRPAPELSADGDGLVDVEHALTSLGVVAECEDGSDLCLDREFRAAWHREAAALDLDDDRRGAIADMLGVEPETLSVDAFGAAAVVRYDGDRVGQWESEAALVADVAADRALAALSPGWSEVDVVNRSRILESLRMFLDTCPACSGQARMGQETVESCCRSLDVVAVTCQDCGSRLFELELRDEFAPAD